MGFQVANIPSPERMATAAPLCTITCNIVSPSASHLSKNDASILPTIDETQSTSLPPQFASATTYDSDAGAPSMSTLSLHSHSSSSSSSCLSQCSSLASLHSLSIDFNDFGRSDYGPDKAQLQLAAGAISAHWISSATLKSAGDLVSSSLDEDGLFYTASSGSISVEAWATSKRGDFHHCIGDGFGSKKGGPVRAMVVAGDRIFSSHSDLRIRVWIRAECSKWRREKSSSCTGVGGGRGSYKLVATLPTRLDCMARSMTPGGYTEVRRHHKKLWIEHADAISAMAVDSKQGYLYSGSWDRSVKVWRLRDFKCVESFRAHDDAINAVALSAEGGVLYTAAANGKIKVWSREASGRRGHCLVVTLEAHRSAVNALALSADGELLYSGAGDKAIVVWERGDSAQPHVTLRAGALRGHRHAVLSLATSHDTLCSGSADRSIRVWRRLAGRALHVCVAVLQGHAAPVKSLTLGPLVPPPAATSSQSACCLSLVSASLDQDVKMWKVSFSFTR